MKALILFVPSECPNMFLKIIVSKESLMTLIAMIWFLLSMSSHISYKDIICVKVLLHWLHWYRLSPLCVLRCLIRIQFCVKALSHWMQWYGLYPVCVLIFNIRLFKRLITLVAFIFFLSSACFKMIHKMNVLCKGLFSFIASI